MNFNNLAFLKEAQRLVHSNTEITDPVLNAHYNGSGDCPDCQNQKDIIFHLMKQKLRKGNK